jgi:hypothetical protein
MGKDGITKLLRVHIRAHGHGDRINDLVGFSTVEIASSFSDVCFTQAYLASNLSTKPTSEF